MCNLHWWYTFCTDVTLFALMLHLNCTALSQSESFNFFMYIINFVSTLNPGHKCICSRYSWPFYRGGWLSSICSSHKTFPLHSLGLQCKRYRSLQIYYNILCINVLESEWGWMMVSEGEWRWMKLNDGAWGWMIVNDSEWRCMKVYEGEWGWIPGGGGTAICGLYMYVPLWRVWFSSSLL